MQTRRDFIQYLAYGAGLVFGGIATGTMANTVRVIPEGYERVAREFNMPAVVLFGVALQESSMTFGKKGQRTVLPWPWTLNAHGRGYRFNTRVDAYRGLMQLRHGGKRLIDIGPMQVNWHYFSDRLIGEYQALEPYHNLRVGASILYDLYCTLQNWTIAVGKYHAPANEARATSYRQQVFSRLAKLGYIHA